MNIVCVDLKLAMPVVAAKGRVRRRQGGPAEHHQLRSHSETIKIENHISMVSSQRALPAMIGPFWQDTLDQVSLYVANGCRQYTGKLPVV